MTLIKKAFAIAISASLTIYATHAIADDREEQIRCVREGRIFAKDFEQRWSNFMTPASDNPEFHFNKSLQTCLAFTGVLSVKTKERPEVWRFQAITNIYSNKILIYTRYMTDETGKEFYVKLETVGNAIILNREDFGKERETLFRE